MVPVADIYWASVLLLQTSIAARSLGISMYSGSSSVALRYAPAMSSIVSKSR